VQGDAGHPGSQDGGPEKNNRKKEYVPCYWWVEVLSMYNVWQNVAGQ
jgi:hypothetical protein